MGKYIESDIQIRFADADSLGHINNVNLQHYFDVGKMEFYEKVLGKTIDPDAESLILVSIHTNYHRQSRLHSQLVVRTWVEKIGNSSVTIFQHLIDRADGGIKGVACENGRVSAAGVMFRHIVGIVIGSPVCKFQAFGRQSFILSMNFIQASCIDHDTDLEL